MELDDAVLSDIEQLISSTNNPSNTPTVPNNDKLPFSIFRVPAHIRTHKSNNHYFEPRVVSIGPYHRNKNHLRAMEMHKRRYLCCFLEKDAGKREKYVTKIKGLIHSIKKCYFETVDDLTENDFVWMMLLDGCFILQLLIKLYVPKNRCDCTIDPIFSVNWNLPLISTDLLMLENQIPFFVLHNLYEMYSYAETFQTPKPSLDDLLLNFLKQVEHKRQEEVSINFYKWKIHKRKISNRMPLEYQIHHLLHIYYIAYIPVLELTNSPKGKNLFSKAFTALSSLTSHCCVETLHPGDAEDEHLPKENNQPSEHIDPLGETTCTLVDIPSGKNYPSEGIHHEIEEICPQECDKMDSSGDIHLMEERILILEKTRLSKETSSSKKTRYPRMIPCATDLEEFGITFMKEELPKSFLDISFVRGVLRGVLKIPRISIEEATKPKFMNLVAFEQSSGMEHKHMTSYVFFMDFLLNTGKDVIVLQRDNIIENKLANEDQVAEFFSQLHGCCYINFDKHHLAPVFRDVKAYCDAWWPKHKARLYRDYFSNPWAIFSLSAALLVLSITVFRTVCFILSAFFHRHLN